MVDDAIVEPMLLELVDQGLPSCDRSGILPERPDHIPHRVLAIGDFDESIGELVGGVVAREDDPVDFGRIGREHEKRRSSADPISTLESTHSLPEISEAVESDGQWRIDREVVQSGLELARNDLCKPFILKDFVRNLNTGTVNQIQIENQHRPVRHLGALERLIPERLIRKYLVDLRRPRLVRRSDLSDREPRQYGKACNEADKEEESREAETATNSFQYLAFSG